MFYYSLLTVYLEHDYFWKVLCFSLFVAVLVDNFQLTLYATHGEAKEQKEAKLDMDDDNLSECKYNMPANILKHMNAITSCRWW